MGTRKVPEVVIRRLPVYLRILEELAADGVEVVSSSELSLRSGHSSEQIRKDFAHFGAFGTRGVGYRTRALARRLERILGLDRQRNAVLVGVGNLGTALARYLVGHPGHHMRLVGLFDRDPDRVGQEVDGLEVQSADDLAESALSVEARIGIVAVPASQAQKVADDLIAGGVQTILNFSPVKLRVGADCFVRNIDIMLELQSLSYYVSDREISRSGKPHGR